MRIEIDTKYRTLMLGIFKRFFSVQFYSKLYNHRWIDLVEEYRDEDGETTNAMVLWQFPKNVKYE